MRGRAALAVRGAAAALAVACALLAPPRAFAQADPSGRWMTLETAHFRVHVRPAQDSLGVRVAGEAEAAWAALAARLPAPRRKVDLVVDDHVDFANGVTTVFPTPRIVVYPVPPVADVELQRYDRWLRILVTHELAHVFHLDLARGWWRVGRALLGRAPLLFPNAYLPTWLLEGLAEHYESVLSAAGREAGSYHREVVGAQAAERGGLRIDAANATSPIWPGGYRPYAFGGEFLRDLAARAGDSAIGRLAVRTAAAAIPYIEVNRAFRLATGVSATKGWREWQAEVRGAEGPTGGAPSPAGPAVPAPAPAAPSFAAPRSLRGLRQLVAPRVSADGRRVLFVLSDGVDEPRIAVLDRASGAVRPLARFNDGSGVAWDSGGSGAGVVASEYDFTDPYTLRADLVRVDADGRERRLTRGARLLAPDVARDGAMIAVRLDAGTTALVRLAGGTAAVLVPARPLVEWAQPRLSRDGRLLAATRAVGGDLDIVLLTAEGRVIRQVTRDAAVDQMPAFSADGTWLFWSSDRSGRPEVYAARTDVPDAGWWRVTAEPFGAYAPAPASDSVFYLAYHADGYRLATVPFDTSAWTRVPADPTEPGSAAADSAAAAIADTGPRTPILARHAYRPWPALLPQYWLPIGAQQGSAGWLGLYTSGSDALGRHEYGFDALVGTGLAAGTWRADVSYAYAGLRRVVLDAGLSRSEDTYLLRRPPPDSGFVAGCCGRTDEVGLGATVPLVRYRSAAVVRVAGEYQDEWGRERAGGVVSAAAARVVAPAFAISTQRGWRVSAFARRRWRLDGSAGAGYTEGVARASLYLPLPRLGFARQVLAVHAAAGWLAGTDTVFFGAGGVSGGSVPLLPGISAGSTGRDFPVRGYQPAETLGRAAAAATLEWRVPLALVGRGVGLVPGVLDRLSLAAFADAGAAWSPAAWTARFRGLPSRTGLVSAGAEGVMDLGVFYDFPVRLRAGVAERLRGRRGASGYLAAGAAF